MPPGRRKTFKVENNRHAFAYIFEGSGDFRDASKPFGVLTEKGTPDNEFFVRETTGNRSLVLFDSGDEVTVQAGEEGIRFLLISGKPIAEPVAWYGPIVMNTQDELRQAVSELRDGTFIKHPDEAGPQTYWSSQDFSVPASMRAGALREDLAVPEDDQRRDAADLVFGRERRFGLGVHFQEAHPRLHLGGHAGIGGRHGVAGAAPVRPEIGDDRDIVPLDLLEEARRRSRRLAGR